MGPQRPSSSGFQFGKLILTSASFLVILARTPNCVLGIIYNLKAATGEFKTYNYPGEYPNSHTDVWNIDLQKYERLTLISGTSLPSFEACCDRFYVKVNGTNVLDLGSKRTLVGSEWWSYDGPAQVQLAFSSDHSVTRSGLKGTYRITCSTTKLPGKLEERPTRCVFGTCSVSRTSSAVNPVACSCPKGFSGTNCNEVVHDVNIFSLTQASGDISTPNFPSAYPNRRNTTWNLELKQFEEIEFFRATDSSPSFETCCDSFNLVSNGERLFSFSAVQRGQVGTSLTTIKATDGPKLVSIIFSSDGITTGTGYKIKYTVSCSNNGPCLNGGSCRVQRDATSAKPVTCECTKEFTGPRCETAVPYSHQTLALRAQSGYIQTPLFPQNYTSAQNNTWLLTLQPFESVTFKKVGDRDPRFETCCDFFKLYANNSLVGDLASLTNIQNGRSLVDPITSPFGTTRVLLHFFSDGGITGNGLKLSYQVQCMAHFANPQNNACLNGGTCRLDRNSTYAGSPRCDCQKGFEGQRCERAVEYVNRRSHLMAPNGIIETPMYPMEYPTAHNITWEIVLKPFEFLNITRRGMQTPSFEQCCDFVRLFVNGSLAEDLGIKGRSELAFLTSPGGHTRATITFFSDARTTGNGISMDYAIRCMKDFGNPQDNACLYGGTCRLDRNSTYVGPPRCDCQKGFVGPRCERTIGYMNRRSHLMAPNGIIETPMYPMEYPTAHNITWEIVLKPFEFLNITRRGTQTPSFERCCDFMRLFVNGSLAEDLGIKGKSELAFLTSPGGHTRATVTFFSDARTTGNGISMDYAIGCMKDFGNPGDNACLNGGQCTPDRNSSYVGPVKCQCGKEYRGTRCEQPLAYTKQKNVVRDQEGSIMTPEYPQSYPVGQNITWNLDLQPFETITFTNHDDRNPDFETGFDFMKLYVNNLEVDDFSIPAGAKTGSVLRRVSSPNSYTKVKIHFFSDGANVGAGARIDFGITCINDSEHSNGNACLNGGVCSVRRTPTSVGGVRCQCPEEFYGSRCQMRALNNREVLQAQTGIIKSRNFPRPYRQTASFTWTWNLQPYETLTIKKHGPLMSTFEACCDFVKLFINGTFVEDLKQQIQVEDGKTVAQIRSPVGQTQVLLKFFSDGRRTGTAGVSLKYNVTCMKHNDDQDLDACINGGRCRVTRSSTLALPVECVCPKNFFGPRCAQPVIFTREESKMLPPSGTIKTPNYPENYPNGVRKVWEWQLAPFEEIDFTKPAASSTRADELEKGSDFMKLFVNNEFVTDFGEMNNESITVSARSEPMDVLVKFSSDGGTSAKGLRLLYTMKCAENACLNGGECSLARSTITAGPIQCACQKGFTGSRCEDRWESLVRRIALSNKSGYLETPGYPQPYPDLTNLIWILELQQFEVFTFEEAGSIRPSFELCCDILRLTIDGVPTIDLRQAVGIPGRNVTTIEANEGPKTVAIEFSSDGGVNGNGFKGRYSIDCIEGKEEDSQNACLNRGICQVSRTNASVGPVDCKCTKAFQGKRCPVPVLIEQQRVHLSDIHGTIATPGFPMVYENAREVVWTWSLRPYEYIRLSKVSEAAPKFETCCDFLTLRVNGSFLTEFSKIKESGQLLLETLEAGSGEAEVTLRFFSDETKNGNGIEIQYEIGCTMESNNTSNIACLNGGQCLWSRESGSVKNIECKCLKGFYGPRCEHAMNLTSRTIHLTSATGIFETPGFPAPYPDETSVTWVVDLQKHESIVFQSLSTQNSSFESCCDFFSLSANGKEIADFRQHNGVVGEEMAAISAREGPLQLMLNFRSDGGINGQGMKGSYKITCIDEDYAGSGQMMCFNGGKCSVNRTESATGPVFCICPSDFKGPKCEKVIHQCTLDCGPRANCLWDHNKFSCKCAPGFWHNGTGCEDIDECLESPCDSPQECVNKEGSYDCKCLVELGFQELKRNGRTECIHSGCSHPWIQNAKQTSCYLLSQEKGDEQMAEKLCNEHGAVMAEIEDARENSVVGLAANHPLVWIGLSDQESERSWKWTRASKAMEFKNWGPGYPIGQGDFAVLYPNTWTLGNCAEKKRFLCQTSDPFCPSEWIRLDGNPSQCYYQSNYLLDHKSASAMCSFSAFGGQLARWDEETSLAFKPEFWDTSKAKGLAHFWVGVDELVQREGNAKVEREKEESGREHDFEAKNGFRDADQQHLEHCPRGGILSACDTAGNELAGRTGLAYQDALDPVACPFVFPNRWADYSAKDVSSDHLPSVVCNKPTTYKFHQKLNADKEETTANSQENTWVDGGSSGSTGSGESQIPPDPPHYQHQQIQGRSNDPLLEEEMFEETGNGSGYGWGLGKL